MAHHTDPIHRKLDATCCVCRREPEGPPYGLTACQGICEPGRCPDNYCPDRVDNFPDLRLHHNCMADALNRDLYCKLKDLRTPKGFSLDRCIQTGVDNPGHPFIYTVGCVAGDEESYHVFAALFDQIIDKRHGGYPPDAKHVTCLDSTKLEGDGIFDENYVLSCRVRTGRSIRGLRLPPACDRAERREVERIVCKALAAMDGEFKGTYYPLATMTEEDQNNLIEDHFLFDKPVSPLLLASRMARDWPDARGIWHNQNKTFLVWINEEDHMRIISMEEGGNMKRVFERWCDGLKTFEETIRRDGHEFMWNEHHGYILTCPSNLGTGMRAGVHVKLPLLSQKAEFKQILENLRLQKRGAGGVDAEAVGGLFDISNADRLGQSEVELLQDLIDGVKTLIEIEKQLESGREAKSMIPTKKKKSIQRGCKKPTIPTKMVVPRASNYPNIENHSNWMAKVLTAELYEELRNLATESKGFTLDEAIQTGVDNPGSPTSFSVGAVAGDEESYEKLAQFFNPVIQYRHNGYTPDMCNKTCLDPKSVPLGNDLDADYALSCRIRSGRSIRGFALPPASNRYERRMVERIAAGALNTMCGEFRGHYYALRKLTEVQQRKLRDEHFLFDKLNSSVLLSADMVRDWPDARGIWYNNNKNFLVWINEEEHVRITAMEKGGTLLNTFTRFCNGMTLFENALKRRGNEFMWTRRLGYIVTCPSNLGTGLRCDVKLKLPLLSATANFNAMLKALRLQKRSPSGNDDGCWEISNIDRLGFTEAELVLKVYEGSRLMISMEKRLETGKGIEDLMPEIPREVPAEEALNA